MSVVVLSPVLREQLVAWSRASAPREACGILIGSCSRSTIDVVRVLVADNLAVDDGAFEVDPGAIVAAANEARSLGLDIVGFWHAHPRGPAIPSTGDAERASWPGHVCAVVSPSGSPRVRVWRLLHGSFVELDLAASASCAARFLAHNSRSHPIEPTRSS